MNTTETIRKRLISAQKAIEAALRELESAEVRESTADYNLPKCMYCGEPIQPGEPITREIHKRCYQDASTTFVRPGIKDWDQLEKEGLVGPRGSPGRPKRNPKLAAEIKSRIRRNKEKSD